MEIWPDGTVAERYRFRHSLHQQVVYDRMSEGSRVESHRRIGCQIEESYGSAVGERAAELARHFERGRNHARALWHRRKAADNALQRCAYEEAVKHLTTARTLLASLPEGTERTRTELAVLTTLGPSLIATKGHAAPEVEHAYVRARELCLQLEEIPPLFPMLRGLSMLYLNRAELQRVGELAEERLRLAQRNDDPVALTGAHDALGAILYHLAEFPLARLHLEEGLALSRAWRRLAQAVPDGATDHGVACLGHLGWTLWCLGFPGQALQRSREAIALAQELSHPFSLTQALYWGAQLHQFCLDARGTQERAQAAMALAAAHGFAQQQAQALLLYGWALAGQGQHTEGIARMREGLEGWKATGARLLRPYYLALLAEAYGQQGQAEEGLRLLGEAQVTARQTGERSFEAELLRLQGELCLPGDAEHVEAEGCFRQALDVARRQQARSLELRATLSLARLWQRQGRRRGGPSTTVGGLLLIHRKRRDPGSRACQDRAAGSAVGHPVSVFVVPAHGRRHYLLRGRDRDAWRPGARWAPRDRRLLRVLELRRRFQRFLRRSTQDDLALLLLELAHRHRDLMLSDAEESANADDRV